MGILEKMKNLIIWMTSKGSRLVYVEYTDGNGKQFKYLSSREYKGDDSLSNNQDLTDSGD